MTDLPATLDSPRPWRKHALVWLVGLGLLAWLLRHVPLATVRSALAAPTPAIWALTLSGLLISYLMRAARLQVVLGLDDATPGRRVAGLRLDALRVILMHNAAVNLLPMRAGELSFPWLASRQLNMALDRSVACLLWMRLQDLAVLIALGLLCWPGLAPVVRMGALGLLAGGWLGGVWLLKILHGVMGRREHQTPSESKISGLLGKLHTALIEPHHHRPAAWAFTWANWSIKLAAGALLMSTITHTSWAMAWSGALGGELAAVVPLQGPAGFGTYEAGVWAGFALQLPAGSASLLRAVPAALALHLCFLLCAVLAGAVAWATPAWSTPRLPD
jgi:hypothetical protein